MNIMVGVIYENHVVWLLIPYRVMCNMMMRVVPTVIPGEEDSYLIQ